MSLETLPEIDKENNIKRINIEYDVSTEGFHITGNVHNSQEQSQLIKDFLNDEITHNTMNDSSKITERNHYSLNIYYNTKTQKFSYETDITSRNLRLGILATILGRY